MNPLNEKKKHNGSDHTHYDVCTLRDLKKTNKNTPHTKQTTNPTPKTNKQQKPNHPLQQL